MIVLDYSIQGGILCHYTAFVGFIRRDNPVANSVENDSSLSHHDSSNEAMETDQDNIGAGDHPELDLWNPSDVDRVEFVGNSNTEEHNTMGRPNMRRAAGHSRPAGNMGSAKGNGEVSSPSESSGRFQPYDLINLASWDGRIKPTEENIRQIDNRTHTYWRHPEDPNYFDEYSFNWDRIRAV